jgi:mono/diheme cytochrome c family protein
MPSFANRLSDQEVAQLATFVRSGWSNHASAVTASEVAKTRATVTR